MSNLRLPIQLLVNVGVDYAPRNLQREGFTQLCIIGSSANTRGTEQGTYSSLQAVSEHYANDTNEYKIAEKLFMQSPRPKSVMIVTVDGIVFPAASDSE